MRKHLFLMLMAFFTINVSSQTKKPSKILSKSPNGYIRCYSTEYEKSIQKKTIEELVQTFLKIGLLPKFQNKILTTKEPLLQE